MGGKIGSQRQELVSNKAGKAESKRVRKKRGKKNEAL